MVNSCKLALIVPCYNEGLTLEFSAQQLLKMLKELIANKDIALDSCIVFIDDGSSDNTFSLMQKLNQQDSIFQYVKLTTNCGHQSAMIAGLFAVEADIFITIDADLQDDINLIPEMVKLNAKGFEIVYGVRKKRDNDNFFKKYTAFLYYKILNMMSVKVIPNHADYRLMSKKVVDTLRGFPERNLFLRGLLQNLGFSTTKIYGDRLKREYGVTKYTIPKMLKLAFDGIFAFSFIPLRLIFCLSLFFMFFSILILGYVGYSYYFKGSISGWASIMASIYFLGSCLLISLAIIGEYIARIYIEVKQRPLYIIEDKSW
ncbi:putative glycosyltransferase YkoT [Candidatus Hepatincola sp. Av]